MSSAAITQCPHCRAKFRVRAEQARAHSGLVRCGACRGVFDAREHLIEGSLDEQALDSDTFGGPQTIVAGIPPTAHDRSSDEISDEAIRAAAREAVAKPVARSGAERAPSASAISAQQHDEQTQRDPRDYDWRAPPPPLTRGQKFAFGSLALIAAIALVAQSAYWFRDELASRFPAIAPQLADACAALGCRVSPPRRPDALGFVGSELAADPAHKGLHVFSATLRNTSAQAIALPSLVLTLEGVGGEPIARSVFSPVQYAPANANLARGLEGGSDLEVKLYLDVSPSTPVGFKADHAYF